MHFLLLKIGDESREETGDRYGEEPLKMIRIGAKYTDIAVIVRLISTEELRFLSAFIRLYQLFGP